MTRYANKEAYDAAVKKYGVQGANYHFLRSGSKNNSARDADLAASMYQTSPRGMGTNDGGPAPSSTGSLGAVKTPVPVRGGGGVPLQGPGGRPIVRPRPGMVKGPGGVRFEGRPGPRRGPAMPYGGMGGPVKTGLGRTAMRGGGLARKGVGMALARGGLVKANGCAQRGKTKGKMV